MLEGTRVGDSGAVGELGVRVLLATEAGGVGSVGMGVVTDGISAVLDDTSVVLNGDVCSGGLSIGKSVVSDTGTEDETVVANVGAVDGRFEIGGSVVGGEIVGLGSKGKEVKIALELDVVGVEMFENVGSGLVELVVDSSLVVSLETFGVLMMLVVLTTSGVDGGCVVISEGVLGGCVVKNGGVELGGSDVVKLEIVLIGGGSGDAGALGDVVSVVSGGGAIGVFEVVLIDVVFDCVEVGIGLEVKGNVVFDVAKV